jgi:nucleoside-diphosphate-sugar epimerase
VNRLLHHGATDIRCLVRKGRDTSTLAAIAGQYPDAAVEMCAGDLRSCDYVKRSVDGVEVIYHLAAGVTGSPSDLFQNTVVASKNLLEALDSARLPRVVLVSSFAVYGTSNLDRGTVINESTGLEQHPERRDAYSFAKIRQERLFWEYRDRIGFPLVVVRPGVVYGPGGTPVSTRIGLRIFGLFFRFGGSNLIPLTYVDNCSEAIVIAGRQNDGDVFNSVDDDLPTAKEYLSLYRRRVEKMPYVPAPYFLTMFISKLVAKYHVHSKGQLPDILTPYKTANTWKGHSFDNSKLKSIGWTPFVPTDEGLAKCFAYWRELFESNGNG